MTEPYTLVNGRVVGPGHEPPGLKIPKTLDRGLMIVACMNGMHSGYYARSTQTAVITVVVTALITAAAVKEFWT